MFTIRPAVVTDAAGMARVHVDGWRRAYPGIVPQEFLDTLSYAKRTERWQAILDGSLEPEKGYAFQFVAVDPDGQVLGLCGGGPERDGDPLYLGELYGIYVHPDSQGLGIGRVLVKTMARCLYDQGFRNMLLWVLKENHPARGFYAHLGGRPYKQKPITLGGVELVEVAYVWDELDELVR